MNEYFKENYYKITQNLRIKEDSYDSGLRGLLFFPKSLNKQFFKKPSLNYFNNNLSFQMFCLNLFGKN